ncbi:alpha/beta fold hydrolase [Paracoccus sediminicola]|uniref:alpha/beta fold hydrolase n=1 Tax=Paracoccus sediminicola TaxID=3017783 RepID=UPI0022EFE64A|nr:alpha/beta fold hydrolase [Paracoccus sediminicola]WBU56477.1 alpha/beta fold hydrolase [Paracoccus sediminicola]
MSDRLWSRSEGEGPPVVFLHGWMMTHDDEFAIYDPIFAARGHRRIYIDLPGMGNSAEMPVPHDLDGFADLLCQEISAQLGEERFLLSGSSAGALIACGVAARLPGRLRGLMLRIPVVKGPEHLRDLDPPVPVYADPALLDEMPPEDRAVLDTSPLIQRRDWIAAMLDKLRGRVLPAFAAVNLDAVGPVRDDPSRYDMRRNIEAFDRPALILVARQDGDVGWRDAVAKFGSWPRATVAVIDAAGHEFPLPHQMPLLSALVDDWLDRLELAP